MAWNFDDLYEGLGDPFRTMFDSLRSLDSGTALSTLLSPVDPYNSSALLTPVVAACAAAGVVVLTGVAVSGFAVAFLALLAVLFLLSEVFGYELSIGPVA